MLRVVPSFFAIKLWGVLVMFGAIVVLFLVPWLDKSQVKSYPLSRQAVVADVGGCSWCASSGWARSVPARVPIRSETSSSAASLTFLYFVFFITMPLWTKLDKTKPVPERVTTHD